MSVLDNLNSVLQNVEGQKKTMDIAKKQAEIVGATLSPEVQAAINLLVDTFTENPVQAIGRIVGAQLQLKSLESTMREVDSLIATVQTVLSSEELLANVEKQKEVNAQPQSPLPVAAGASGLSAANDTAPAQVAASVAEESSVGAAPVASEQGNGTSGS